MSISRIPLWLSVLAAVVGLCSQASAQGPTTTHEFGGAGFWEPDHLGLFQPQIPLNYFDPDYQFFAPADVSTFGGYPEPNHGLFFTYSRLYWNVQRSETDDAEFQGDFTWGNRFEFGYMFGDPHGWLVSITHLDGPNAVGPTIFAGIEPSPLDPDLDVLVERQTSINNGDFDSVEVNKTFRWEPVGQNYIIEPMIGARYMKFIDRNPEIETLTEIDDQGVPTGNILTRGFLNVVENNILGGQLGVRIHRQTERWVTAVESKFVPAINYQFYPTEDFSEFTMFGQVTLTAAYNLTRDISIGAGADILHFGTGIARGANAIPPINDQDLTIAGFHFTVQINR